MPHESSRVAEFVHRGRAFTLATLGVVLALLLAGCPPQTASNPPTPNDADHSLGDPNAPVTVIEYGDFQCPLCGAFATQTFPQIKSQYIDTGQVRWIFREFPLTAVHPQAQAAAEAAECAADQGLFWEYADILFANQTDLSDAALESYATEAGLNVADWSECFKNGGGAGEVAVDVESGEAAGVPGTPTFFIGSTQVVGFQTFAQFSQALDTALAAAGD